MRRSLTAMVLCATTLACASRGQRANGGDAVASPDHAYADTAQFREAAQAIVSEFGAQVSRARGGALAPAPEVEVRNTPQLISFQSTPNRIVVPWWNTTAPETRAVFRTFAGGSDAEAERMFRFVFNRFLIAHEAGHWFQARANRREASLYANEDAANRLAVAFWRTQPGGERLLAEVERLVTRAAEALPDPTPRGEDPVAYFGANYQTLGADPLKYGYYQFRFMRDALRARATLDFPRLVAPSVPASAGEARLDSAARHVVAFLRGEHELDPQRLADTVVLRLAPEGGGHETRLPRAVLGAPSAWAVPAGRARYALAPPAGMTQLTTVVGRHFNCRESGLATRAPAWAVAPHVGVRLAPGGGAASCLRTWNATFVFDTSAAGRLPQLVGVLYDQWEW